MQIRTPITQRDQWYPGEDAAFAGNLTGYGWLVIGYLGGPNAYHPWTGPDWAQFPDNPKLPTWVGGDGGHSEGLDALSELHALDVPAGVEVMLDMETRIDRTYVQSFGAVLNHAGYKVLVYGSVSTIFHNPPLNGYAVADPTGVEHMYPHPGVRLTQWEFGPEVDRDAVKKWLVLDGLFWRH